MLSDVSLQPPGEESQSQTDEAGSLMSKLGLNRNRVIAFVLLLMVLSLLLGSLSFLFATNLIFIVQVAGLFALGYLHALILRANVPGLSDSQKSIYSFLLGSLVFVLLSALFYFKENFSLLFIGTCTCAFLLPFVLGEAAKFFTVMYTVPTSTWRYNPGLPLQKSTTFLNSMPLRFRIETDSFSDEERVVFFRAPVRMKLGNIFYHTVQEQNEKTENPINLVDPLNEPYEWSFSVNSLGWTQFLDPDAGLIENGIKPNTIITARRLRRAAD